VSETDLLSSAASESDAGSARLDQAPSAAQPDTADAPTTTGAPAENGSAPRRRGGLSGMVLAELRELASRLGIPDTASMRKGDLIAAIKRRQEGGRPAPEQPTLGAAAQPQADIERPLGVPEAAPPALPEAAPPSPLGVTEPVERPLDVPEQRPAEEPAEEVGAPAQRSEDAAQRPEYRRRRGANRPAGAPVQHDLRDGVDQTELAADRLESPPTAEPVERPDQPDRIGGVGNGQTNGGQIAVTQRDDEDDETGRGRRGRRFRDRRRNRSGDRRPETAGGEPEVREDDVLLPVAGILDVLENYAFVRTSGYLAGPNDVYVSLSLVRKYGLRRGDAITGAVRQPRDGEQQRQKFNPLVRVDTVNGLDVEAAKQRPEFTKLTPLYPNERLRLETEPHILTTRVIDLVMPVGKGQRALIVSPPKAGKTMILQAIANAITRNNPECHLMVVLVDERPEEVTDMQRSVKGEVIASTFDRPPSDHTTVAELSIERAKRLVEMGHDVVVLLDSITRLGRAYNLAAPASGRILSGGVDSTALYPPKRFLGAARNIENGGSLTIFATALVETGSTMDTVIFEEFKGTGNAELKLDRKIADKRVFPAIDIDPSGTRKEELLLSPDELAVLIKLRRVLAALDSQQAIDLLLDRLRKTRTNIEFLMQVAKTTPGSED
jgi:transcription termination factor Rho